ncbi:MAG: PhoH family protein [Deltaproteobacteria bacterium]|nr:PhoH family protein [Deltaproteobacteria bacterium]
MKKRFVLDTNVLLHDPGCIFAFEDNTVVIPIYVIQEIDRFKRELSELGRSAREVSRTLDTLRQEGPIATGVALRDGGRLYVAFSSRHLTGAESHEGERVDDRILAVCLDAKEEDPESPVVLVTKDINLRIRANALGIDAEDYDHDRVEINELYTGMVDVEMAGEEIDLFYSQGWLPLADLYHPPNEFVHLKNHANPSHSALGKVSLDQGRIVPIGRVKEGVWGVRPRNKEQSFAIDLLLNDNIKLVTLVGKAGTGKTLLAIAAGLHKATEEGVYQRILVSRPIFPLGKDLGYLPGTVEEKLSPWMQPIFDNVEFLMGLSNDEKRRGRSYRELVDLGILQIEPLTYIRGRSIPNQFMVVDEAQNLTPHEVKTIVSRAGEGTKIVLTGDPYQIDNPYMDATNNGLVHVVNRFRPERIAGHVTLLKGERSELAELAANLL